MNKMNFTVYNKNDKNSVYSQPNINTGQLLSFRQVMRQYNPNIANQSNAEVVEKKVETQPKKMKWGEPTWFLFHTLAYKVKEADFPKVRSELLGNIYNICSNLPCPICAEHAVEYMKKINFNSIQTRRQLIDLLFNFHNEVNKKKGFPLFKYEDLDDKYSKAVTKNIIFNFMIHYQDKHKSIHMISNDLYRARQVIVLKEWFNKNFKYFDP
jgi:hypothetical protein